MATMLQYLEVLFMQHIEPVRPGRKYSHQRIIVKAEANTDSYRNPLKHF